MDQAMTTSYGGVQPRLLRRDTQRRWLAGLCAGIARRYGFDVALVRLAFVVAVAAGGLGIVAYGLGWLVVPAGEAETGVRRRAPAGRGAVQVALGTGLLLLSILLTFRALGIWFSDALVWPLVLVASGGALIWRASQENEPQPTERPPAVALSDSPPAAAEVEEHHGVPVEVVTVGDRTLDEDVLVVVAAAREAMTNAAKFGGDSPVDVYAEADPRRVHVFVRDRGPGFDPDAVPADRRGVRESVVGRMARHGGSAVITSSPTGGTEVELLLERESG
jgi:phage shock protein PspC (stress-responsive transcriptional regulator)